MHRSDTHRHGKRLAGTSADVAVHHVGVCSWRLESVARMTTSCSLALTDAALSFISRRFGVRLAASIGFRALMPPSKRSSAARGREKRKLAAEFDTFTGHRRRCAPLHCYKSVAGAKPRTASRTKKMPHAAREERPERHDVNPAVACPDRLAAHHRACCVLQLCTRPTSRVGLQR